MKNINSFVEILLKNIKNSQLKPENYSLSTFVNKG